MDVKERLMEGLRCADRAGSVKSIEQWIAEYGPQAVFPGLIEPVLEQLGQEWYSGGSVSLAQLYVASKVVEDTIILSSSSGFAKNVGKGAGRPVVLGNIEDDFHGLGRKIVATFLRADGWDVHELGNDELSATFVDTAVKVGARVVGASAMTMTTARNIGKLREEIDRRGLTGKLQLAVGGAVFRVCPDLIKEVGADGSADSASGVSSLFDRLWAVSLEKEVAA